MVPCPAASGSSAESILAHFELSTGERFTPSPGSRMAQRVTGVGRVLGNLVREASMLPPLQRISRQGTWYYNRAPPAFVDVDRWRQSAEATESLHPALPLHHRMASVDETLAAWVRHLRTHQFLKPVPEERGECSMALLLLWEVEHGATFPTQAGQGISSTLIGFTRRLQLRVRRDPDLDWLTWKDVHLPLAPGLPCSHHLRWSVQITPPPAGSPDLWYREFTSRWKAYLLSLANPAPSPTSAH
eukprot:EG_transcript_25222